MLRAQEALAREGAAAVPFCAFNGGSDAWVDVGNKRVGVTGLQRFLAMGLSLGRAVVFSHCTHKGDPWQVSGRGSPLRASPRQG